MLPLSLVQDRLRLTDGLLPAFALLLPRGLFPLQFTRAALLLSFIGESYLPLCRPVDRAGRWLVRLAAFGLAGGFRRPRAATEIRG
jgi:hypothetical protein